MGPPALRLETHDFALGHPIPDGKQDARNHVHVLFAELRRGLDFFVPQRLGGGLGEPALPASS